MKPGRLLAASTTSILLAAVAPGCMGQFDGPYACNPGYVSCQGVATAGNPGCETDITSNPYDCGDCGVTCPMGALCVNSACTAPAKVLTTDANPAELGIDTPDLFYVSNQDSSLHGLSKSGGAAFPIALPGSFQLGPNLPFAVDDSGVYYVAQGQTQQGPTVSIEMVPPDGAPRPAVVIATLQAGGQDSLQSPYGLRIFGPTLFLLGSVQSGGPTKLGIWSVPKVGGALKAVANLQNNSSGNGIAIDANSIYLVSNANGVCGIARVPVAGGSPSALSTDGPNGGTCPEAIASDGTSVYWSWSTSFSDNNGLQQCASYVYGTPVGGGPVSTVAQLSDTEAAGAIAVDGGNLYLVTSDNVWRVPSAGGTPVLLAANLNGASSGQKGACGGGGNGQGTSPSASIALDSANVYVALSSGLFKLPK